MCQPSLLVFAALVLVLVEGVEVGGSTNTKIFTGNQALDSGALGFGLGVGASAILPALLGGGAGCGRRRRRRRRRDAQGTDQRFFLGGGNNCGNNYNNGNYYPSHNYPSNNYPSNSYPSNNYPSNNYPSNNYPSNNYNTGNNYGCRCTSLTWRDHYGNINGNCISSDPGKGAWCYTTGWNNGCPDNHSSKQYPNNPWSYQACRNNGK